MTPIKEEAARQRKIARTDYLSCAISIVVFFVGGIFYFPLWYGLAVTIVLAWSGARHARKAEELEMLD